MKAFNLKIATPDGLLFDGECAAILLRTVGGDVEILSGHADFVSPLGTGRVKISMPDGTSREASASEGFLSVKSGSVSVLTTTFEYAEDIDLSRAERAKARAEEKLKTLTDDKELELAKAKLSRALSRISVAKR